MILIPILNPKIELSAFSRSAEPGMSRKVVIDIDKKLAFAGGGSPKALGPGPSVQSPFFALSMFIFLAIRTSTGIIGSALRENADNSILRFKTGIKISIF